MYSTVEALAAAGVMSEKTDGTDGHKGRNSIDNIRTSMTTREKVGEVRGGRNICQIVPDQMKLLTFRGKLADVSEALFRTSDMLVR